MKIGYACTPIMCQYKTTRTLTLKNYSEENIYPIIENNLYDLLAILKYNSKHHIYMFRISSDIIPLGSHHVNTFPWQKEFKSILDEIGNFIIENNMRVSMHPGQYTLLNSPKDDVVKKSIKDLSFHCNFLDSLNLPPSHKIILHTGGVYGDKASATDRFINTYKTLPENIKNRLIIENDERFFSVYDLFDINEKIKVPIIFDNLHYECFGDLQMNIADILTKVKTTWKDTDGDMKIHYSQQNPLKKKGAHGDTTILHDFISFLKEYDFTNVDIMLEVKDKNISAIKVNNYLQFIKNMLSDEIIKREVNNYSLFILERLGSSGLSKIQEIEHSLDLLGLYELVDSLMYVEYNEDNFRYALNKAFSLLRYDLNNKEISHYEKNYKNKDYLKCKEYLKKLADKHDLAQCGYYFCY